MKISHMFTTKKPVISFEIFPPKPEYAVSTIFDTLEGLRSLAPDFISITYGAGGGSSSTSFEIAEKVKNEFSMEVLSHFTCVGASAQEVEQSLEELKVMNVENILALRGDLPAGSVDGKHGGEYRYAKDLIAHINRHSDFCIGAAAYPEGHADCQDIVRNIGYLKQKVENGADFFITQLFFDNNIYTAFLEKVRAAGITIPISVGIMPILSASQITRICKLCGASIPVAVSKMIEKYGANPREMEQAGIEYACSQIQDLLDKQVDGIHLYTMNKYKQTYTIMNKLSLR